MKKIITDFIESFKLFHTEKISASKSELNDNTLFSFVFPYKNIDFDLILGKINSFSPSFNFEKPEEDFKILAFDSIFTFDGKSKNNSSAISTFIIELSKNTFENWGEELSKDIPLFVGGMKFLSDYSSDLWKDFNQSNWYIPKILFIKKGKDRKSTRLNSSHIPLSRMPSSA